MDFSDYLLIPYTAFGRTRAGVDCWGLVCLFYKEKFDIHLTDYEGVDWQDGATISKCILEEAEKQEWVEIAQDAPKMLGDVVVMRMMGLPWHVGIVLSDQQFLHADVKCGICCEKFNQAWKNRVVAYHRHKKFV